MSIRLVSLFLLFACVHYLPIAQGGERVLDAVYVYQLEQHAGSATGLEGDFLRLIEPASGEERFNLYRTYNQLMGAWLQVEFLQALLDLSVAAESHADEEEIGTALRDQAQFVLWELDHDIIDLEQSMSEAKPPSHLRVAGALRSLLSEVRTTVNRLWVDQCARTPCAEGP